MKLVVTVYMWRSQNISPMQDLCQQWCSSRSFPDISYEKESQRFLLNWYLSDRQFIQKWLNINLKSVCRRFLLKVARNYCCLGVYFKESKCNFCHNVWFHSLDECKSFLWSSSHAPLEISSSMLSKNLLALWKIMYKRIGRFWHTCLNR